MANMAKFTFSPCKMFEKLIKGKFVAQNMSF